MPFEAGLAVAICLALLALSTRITDRRLRWLGSGAAVLLAAVSLVAGASYVPPSQQDERKAEGRPVQRTGNGYVTSNACRACHPGNYATWHDSYHRSMTQVAGPDSVAPDFDGVTLKRGGREFRLERRGDEFWVVEKLGRRRRIDRQVLVTTGSHHMQSFWFSNDEGRTLRLFEFSYLIRDQRWTPTSALFLRPPQEGLLSTPPGGWNWNCVGCHTTGGRPRLAEKDTDVVEFGISCESCHGPGEAHVRTHRSPLQRYLTAAADGADETIVNPNKLSHDRSAQVCGQCHGFFYRGPTQSAAFKQNGSSYRPGDDLGDTATPVIARFDRLDLQHLIDGDPMLRGTSPEALHQVIQKEYLLEGYVWPDGVPRVTGLEYNGLVEAPCFRRGTMTCSSCHTLHQTEDDPRPTREWANDQITYGMEGNEACLQCHGDYRAVGALEQHTRHPAESTGSQCYNCHMPHTGFSILKSYRSHTITSPTARESVESGRPNACNQCHLDRTLEWTAANLEAWFGTPPPELSEEERVVSATVLWLLRGDAVQRALAAWTLGWEPAQHASGTDWMAPFLAELLRDPYDAVRYTAGRSLRRVPGFEDLETDYMGDAAAQAGARNEVLKRWEGRPAPSAEVAPALLLEETGELRRETVQALLERRDDRPISLLE